jgi:hypothetical protein
MLHHQPIICKDSYGRLPQVAFARTESNWSLHRG